ncbi:unnamed protein product [Cladocopium goreaui]|uniref:Uncharacterized protein n=1 Tax=Cladocopium goreaui TaxID=2562237 RepID=A0A9P1CN70_9DINO|nr:unnamed protein product [Cladocopium goreaui]
MMRQIAANEKAVKNMAKRQEAFEQEFVQNRTEWQEYVKKQDVAVVEMKADFKKQCNHLVAHNSEIMKDIRRDYAKEIAYIQETRLGIAKTLEELGRTLEDMEDKLAIERRRIDVIHSEICKEIEDLHRWRNTDRAFMEADVHQFRTDLNKEKEGQTHLRWALRACPSVACNQWAARGEVCRTSSCVLSQRKIGQAVREPKAGAQP